MKICISGHLIEKSSFSIEKLGFWVSGLKNLVCQFEILRIDF